jgi:hypothetical protein
VINSQLLIAVLGPKSFSQGWIMRPHNRSKALVFSLVLIVLLGSLPVSSQVPDHKGIGSIQLQGAVTLNGVSAASGATVFAGDLVRTGPDGSALVSLPGRGSIVVAADSELIFPSVSIGSHFVVLHRGKVAFRLLPEASETTAEIGGLVLRPVIGQGVEFEVVIAGDGSAVVQCLSGSVGIIQIQGANSTFLNAGQSAKISVNGSVELIQAPGAPPAGTPAPNTTQSSVPPPSGKSHTAVILLVVGIAGVGAAVAVIVAEHKSAPVSPSGP